jgi:hypothetical protein
MNRRGFFKWFGAVAAAPVAAKVAEAVVRASPMTEALEPPPVPSIKPVEPVDSSVAGIRAYDTPSTPRRYVSGSLSDYQSTTAYVSYASTAGWYEPAWIKSTSITITAAMLNTSIWNSTAL